MLVLIQEELK
ncbi:rCG54612 [Rattus norvegicus]|uniref:RCG54612 n=1 Tax=Rattus norvegicus TaxID=10116 RepID=A6JAF1_RAT|nr:rCG54612 [Rattus norvegicus]